jgi:hypothetical protein
MKCVQLICVLSVFCAVSARSIPNAKPARNGMFFYQSAPSYYKPGTQRAMYVQYGTPYRSTNRRSTEEGGVAAFAAGGTVAAGTYLKEGEIEEPVQPVEPEPAVVRFDDENVQAFAEAEPEQFPLAQSDDSPFVEQEEAQVNEVIPLPQEEPQQDEVTTPEVVQEEIVPVVRFGGAEDSVKTPKELGFPAEAAEVAEPAVEPEVVQAVVPVAPPATKKHVRVELESEDDDEDEFVPFSHKTSVKNGQSGNVPQSSFFPVNFGSTNGGAIAIANSFSTGKGGHATSHATAYGTPGSKSSKRRA